MSNELPPILNLFPLSAAQQQAALARGADVVVTAGAGTGKTRTLVARYLALLAQGVPLRQITAVTFTHKATQEMRNRLRQQIGHYLQTSADEAEQAIWRQHYNELDAARIGTIHSLCGDILRAHPAESGLDPHFVTLDDTQSAQLMQECSEAVVAWAAETAVALPVFELLPVHQLQKLVRFLLDKRSNWATAVGQNPADAWYPKWQNCLEAAQKEAVDQWLALDAWQILHRNQASKADDKMESQRLMLLAAKQSAEGATLAEQLRHLAICREIDLRVGSKKSWPGGGSQFDEVKAAVKTVQQCYKSLKKVLGWQLNDQDEAIFRAMPAIYALFEYANRLYEQRKSERNGVDFDDLEQLACQLLQKQPALRSYWQGQIQALLVDEFQDTNQQQRQLFRHLCPEPGKLFIVGDGKQSIYRFRGADVAVFTAEKRQIAQAGGHVIDLATSYRAHQALLAKMNELLRPVLGDDAPDLPLWKAPFAPLQAGDKKVAYGLPGPFVEFHLATGNKADGMPVAAQALATRLRQLHLEHGVDFGQMAILCRSSRAFAYYENALDAARIPYVTVSGKGFFGRPEIRDLLNMLRVIADPHDSLALVGLLRSPACGLSDLALFHLTRQRPSGGSLWQGLATAVPLADADEQARLQTAVARIRHLHQQAGRIPVADIVQQWLDVTHYRAMLRRVGELRGLRNVAKLLDDIHSSELFDINEFLEYATLLQDSGSRQGEARATASGAVQIMSIHKAKGLEFPVVVLGDASYTNTQSDPFLLTPEMGLVLSVKDDEAVKASSYQLAQTAVGQQEEAESARLLYVALTRAEQLFLVNGTVSMKEQKCKGAGWLGQLGQIVGLDELPFAHFDEKGDGKWGQILPQTAVAVTLYEPNWQATAVDEPVGVAVVDDGTVRPLVTGLQEAIVQPTAVVSEEPETPQRVWQVVPTAVHRTAPAWLVGTLVHEALASWRFPDSGFGRWAEARAREYGLTDREQINHACEESVRLLGQFQKLPIFHEISQAERRFHELPYSYVHDGRVQNGFIDLLYVHDGVWKLVDFKTDQLDDEGELRQLLAKGDYTEQVGQYVTAVGELLGVRPVAQLCFLNMKGGPTLMPVDAAERAR